ETGSAVPAMTVVDSNGTTHNLSDFAGSTVVLEWTNHDCPYVMKHYNTSYDGGNMQNLQKAAATDGVIWLSVISSAPGKQGYVTGEEANALTAKRDAAPAAVILDPEGVKGKTFSAKTTPHMYIINADRTLVYQGAIDDNPSANPDTIKGAKNYVTAALDAVKAGQNVAIGETTPYGCSVKYGS
ncbi:MAG: redoxin family protein, partial [Hyphomonadaceae bacterium]|nr:redoxin family protein [Hyphomonadaceae bacterium]